MRRRICLSEAGSIQRAAGLIRAGELVAFPTETVYGLGANALDAAAVERIYRVKGRPAESPLIVHADSMSMARSIVSDWPDQATALGTRFWPGPLTLVLRKSPAVPDRVTAGLSTVGIRVPAHPVALELIRAAGLPIAAPSANRFQQLSPSTAAHVRAALGDDVAMVLDGGPSAVGIESTVISLAGPHPVLLRPGMISREQIEHFTGPLRTAQPPGVNAHAAPGMHARHYSPATPLVLVENGRLPAGRGAYVCTAHTPAEAARTVMLPGDPAAYAAKLYSALHEIDCEGWDWIAVERPPADVAWEGIRDRLERAARR